MEERKIFAIGALFNTPDEIIKAANATTEKKYTKFDVNTPYPVHGMDTAMKLKPSKLGFVTLAFGLFGAAIALFFMWWSMSINYPIVIGGKPLFSLPAFVPITFEMTVLLATLSTAIGMFAVFFNFPKNTHPLHDTPYMEQVSNDKYGIYIQADDPQFDETQIRDFFKDLGAIQIDAIYYPESKKLTVWEPRFITFLAVVFALVSAGTYFTLNKLLFWTPFNWMVFQSRVDAQSKSTFFNDGFGMRKPVIGTVSRESIPYEYANMKDQPAKPLINPLPASKEVLNTGKRKFDIYCSPCHGYYGDGDSRLRGQFPNPPSLHSQKVRNWQDGNIFHVITNGQNVMPSYATQLSPDERWAVVNYIRALQKAKNATQTDIQKVKEGTK